MLFNVWVNLFVLITGYFGIKNRFKTSQILKLMAQTWFFSVSCMLVFEIGRIETKGFVTIVKSFFPVVFNEYWFITAYVILYLLSPFINRLLLSMSKIETRNLVVLLCILWSVLPCLTLSTGSGLNWTQQIWMFVIYIIGCYIRLYGIKQPSKIMICLFSAILLGSVILIECVALRLPFLESHATYFRWSNTIIAFPLSVMLFVHFSNINMKSMRVINVLSSAALSVYLLHENKYFSELLWNGICGTYNSMTGLIFVSCITILFVYLLGCIAHVLWYMFSKMISKPLARFSSYIDCIIDRSFVD